MKIFFVLLFILLSFPNPAFGSGNKEVDSQDVNEVQSEVTKEQTSMKEQYETGLWIVKPSGNKLTVIGVSNPMLKRQDEIAAAKEDAACKTAMYFFIQGKTETTNNIGSGFFDYQHDSNVEIIYDTEFEKYKKQLTYNPDEDVLVTREGVFVRFQYAAAVTEINYRSTFADGKPDWLRNSERPEFEGYLTAVGFSRNQIRLKDSIKKSTEDAVVRMIESLSTTVNTKEISVLGKGSSSFTHAVSEGTLYCFQVIEFWIEPETRYVYTLAIAKKDG
jgi:hypothetical protein